MRYFIHAAYNGNNYRGWQKLPGIVSVQQVLETTLSKLLKEPIAIVGCGRTDAQVHASQFFFHFDLSKKMNFDLLFRLNKSLPHEILIYDVIPMDGTPHARFDAVERSYDYYLHTFNDPYLLGLSAYYPLVSPNLNAIKQAMALLTNYNDFKCFCKSPLKYEHTICYLSNAELYTNLDQTILRFRFTSNRFLAGMIRIIVGKLVQLGKEELSLVEFEDYLKHQITPKTIVPVHAQGLYLSKVTYPYLNLPNRSVLGNVFLQSVNLLV